MCKVAHLHADMEVCLAREVNIKTNGRSGEVDWEIMETQTALWGKGGWKDTYFREKEIK